MKERQVRQRDAVRTRAELLEVATGVFADAGYTGARIGEMDQADSRRRLAKLTYDHHLANDEFIRLVAIENIHRGRYIRQIAALRDRRRRRLLAHRPVNRIRRSSLTCNLHQLDPILWATR